MACGEVACPVAVTKDLAGLLVSIAAGDIAPVRASLDAAAALATARLARRDEFFIAARHAQVYEGTTALRAAAFTYDGETVRDLVARGAAIRAPRPPRRRVVARSRHWCARHTELEPGTPTILATRQRAANPIPRQGNNPLRRATGASG